MDSNSSLTKLQTMTTPASDFRSLCNEEFWRKHALEQLLHASTSYRLGVYSSEELELYEKRARFFLDRWPQAKPPQLTNEKLHEKLFTLEEQLWEQYKTVDHKRDEFMSDDCFGYALCDYHAVITVKGWVKSPQ